MCIKTLYFASDKLFFGGLLRNTCYWNYISFTMLSWLGNTEGTFRSSSQATTCLPHTMEASHCPFNCWMSSRKVVNTNFYSLWFDPTGNRTRVYRFSSRRSIHLITDRCNCTAHGIIIFIYQNAFAEISYLPLSRLSTANRRRFIEESFFKTEVLSESSEL